MLGERVRLKYPSANLVGFTEVVPISARVGYACNN